MTVTVKYPGWPDRLACPECHCEVGPLGRPNWVAYDLSSDSYFVSSGASRLSPTAAGYRGPDVDEPPIRCDIHDGCRCHESAVAMLRNHYDDEVPA